MTIGEEWEEEPVNNCPHDRLAIDKKGSWTKGGHNYYRAKCLDCGENRILSNMKPKPTDIRYNVPERDNRRDTTVVVRMEDSND